MIRRQIVIQQEAVNDLEGGRDFYNRIEQGLGDYFFDALLADLESLEFHAGIHSRHCEYHRMPSKRFPFSIYYEIKEDLVLVVAVLDMRRNPSWNRDELTTR